MATIWAYARHELLYVAWALTELSLITPLALAYMPWADHWPPGQITLWLLVLTFIPLNLQRIMSLLDVSVSRQQIGMAIGLLLALVLSWRMLLYSEYALFDVAWLAEFYSHLAEADNPYWERDFLIFLLVTLVWWRGMSLAGRRIDINEAGLRLRISALLVAPLVLAVAESRLTWTATPFVLLFILSSLMAIALTRAEQIELDKTGQAFPMSPRWLAIIFATGLFIIFTTGILAALSSGRPLIELVGWLAPVWLAFYFLITSAVAAFAYMLLPLLTLFDWFIHWMRNFMLRFVIDAPEALTPEPIEPLATPLLPDDLFGDFTRTFANRELLIFLIMLAVVLMVALSLSRLLGRGRPGRERRPELATARQESSEELEEQGWGQRLLKRLGFLRQWRAALSIRRIYQQMSQVAADCGYPRRYSETPYEYLASLGKVWPESAADTRLITQAYVQVRYGEIPETKEELDVIQDAWRRLEKSRPAVEETV